MATVSRPDHVFYLMYPAPGGVWCIRQVKKAVWDSIKPARSHYFSKDLSLAHQLIIEVKVALNGDPFVAFAEFTQRFYPHWEKHILASRSLENDPPTK